MPRRSSRMLSLCAPNCDEEEGSDGIYVALPNGGEEFIPRLPPEPPATTTQQTDPIVLLVPNSVEADREESSTVTAKQVGVSHPPILPVSLWTSTFAAGLVLLFYIVQVKLVGTSFTKPVCSTKIDHHSKKRDTASESTLCDESATRMLANKNCKPDSCESAIPTNKEPTNNETAKKAVACKRPCSLDHIDVPELTEEKLSSDPSNLVKGNASPCSVVEVSREFHSTTVTMCETGTNAEVDLQVSLETERQTKYLSTNECSMKETVEQTTAALRKCVESFGADPDKHIDLIMDKSVELMVQERKIQAQKAVEVHQILFEQRQREIDRTMAQERHEEAMESVREDKEWYSKVIGARDYCISSTFNTSVVLVCVSICVFALDYLIPRAQRWTYWSVVESLCPCDHQQEMWHIWKTTKCLAEYVVTFLMVLVATRLFPGWISCQSAAALFILYVMLSTDSLELSDKSIVVGQLLVVHVALNVFAALNNWWVCQSICDVFKSKRTVHYVDVIEKVDSIQRSKVQFQLGLLAFTSAWVWGNTNLADFVGAFFPDVSLHSLREFIPQMRANFGD